MAAEGRQAPPEGCPRSGVMGPGTEEEKAVMRPGYGMDQVRVMDGGAQGGSAGLLWLFEDHDRPHQGWDDGGRRVLKQARQRTTGGGQGDCPCVGSFGQRGS